MLRSNNPQIMSFEEYARRELPRMVRDCLDNAVQTRLRSLDEVLKSDVTNVVSDCQAQVYREFCSMQENEGEQRLHVPEHQTEVGNREHDKEAQTSRQPPSTPLCPGESSKSRFPLTPPHSMSHSDENFKGKERGDIEMIDDMLQQPINGSEVPINWYEFPGPSFIECWCGQCRCSIDDFIDFSGSD